MKIVHNVERLVDGNMQFSIYDNPGQFLSVETCQPINNDYKIVMKNKVSGEISVTMFANKTRFDKALLSNSHDPDLQILYNSEKDGING